MLTYILRRILYSIPVLVVASFLTFVGVRWAYNPLDRIRGQGGSRSAAQIAKEIADRKKALHLDETIFQQWWRWVTGVVRGDFGTSERTHEHVSHMITRAMWPSVQLLFWGTIVSLTIAIGIGVYSSVKQYSAGDYAFTGLSYIGIAMPPFWFGLMGIGLLSVYPITHLHWHLFDFVGLHTTGQKGINLDYFRHLVLPVATLTVQSIASWSRFERASMLDVLHADYVRTARAKGVPQRTVIFKHAFRNALIPLVTVVALDTAFLFGGLLITEQIFSISGMGRLFLDAIITGDAPVLLGWFLVVATAVIVANLFADLMYSVLDPRIRLS